MPCTKLSSPHEDLLIERSSTRGVQRGAVVVDKRQIAALQRPREALHDYERRHHEIIVSMVCQRLSCGVPPLAVVFNGVDEDARVEIDHAL